nr:hypothetical protein [Legionellales bacterium]
MKIIIDKSIIQKFPDTTIGYIVAKLNVEQSLTYVENLKRKLPESLAQRGITKQNLASTPYISNWRETYKTFGVKPKQYKSSVEALTRRVISGKSVWNISSVVDLYNCCSVLSSFPMGGYDISKLHGDIRLRFGNQGETFVPLGASDNESETVETEHVVYSDNDRVICWLWNYKDSQSTCIDESTKYAVFFVDSAFEVTNSWAVTDAINFMNEHLPIIGCSPIQSGVLNGGNLVGEWPELDELSSMSIELPEIQEVKETDSGLLLPGQKKVVATSSAQIRKPRVEQPPKPAFPPIKPRLQSIEQSADEPQQFLQWCAIGEDSKLRQIVAIRSDLTQYYDSLGNYGIHHAVVGRHLSTVQMLLDEFHVELNVQNKLGYTALMLAIRDSNLSLVSKLLSYGAKVHIGVTSAGETAIDLANQKGNPEIIRVLQESVQA